MEKSSQSSKHYQVNIRIYPTLKKNLRYLCTDEDMNFTEKIKKLICEDIRHKTCPGDFSPWQSGETMSKRLVFNVEVSLYDEFSQMCRDWGIQRERRLNQIIAYEVKRKRG